MRFRLLFFFSMKLCDSSVQLCDTVFYELIPQSYTEKAQSYTEDLLTIFKLLFSSL